MRVLEFAFFSSNDPVDERYDNWSRKYEYPWALEWLRKAGAKTVHNTACGGCFDVHRTFAQDLASGFTVVNSDVHRDMFNSVYCDITQPYKGDGFDAVLCISAIEHINGVDVVEVIKNLAGHVKFGGIVIATFDFPGVDLAALERAFGMQCVEPEAILRRRSDDLSVVKLAVLND